MNPLLSGILVGTISATALVCTFHISAYLERESVQQSCDRLTSFVVNSQAYLCEKRTDVQQRLERERRQISELERGSP